MTTNMTAPTANDYNAMLTHILDMEKTLKRIEQAVDHLTALQAANLVNNNTAAAKKTVATASTSLTPKEVWSTLFVNDKQKLFDELAITDATVNAAVEELKSNKKKVTLPNFLFTKLTADQKKKLKTLDVLNIGTDVASTSAEAGGETKSAGETSPPAVATKTKRAPRKTTPVATDQEHKSGNTEGVKPTSGGGRKGKSKGNNTIETEVNKIANEVAKAKETAVAKSNNPTEDEDADELDD